MRKIAIMLLLLLTPLSAGAICGFDMVYLFDDMAIFDDPEPMQDGSSHYCAGTYVIGEAMTLHVVAVFDWPYPSPREIELDAVQWFNPDCPEGGEMVETWFADQVAGDLTTGVTLTWDEPPVPWGGEEDPVSGGGSAYHIGEISITVYDAEWLPQGSLIALGDDNWLTDTWPAEDRVLIPGSYTFSEDACRCTEYTLCTGVGDPSFVIRRPLPHHGQAVPRRFDFSFEVYYYPCSAFTMVPADHCLFSGEVLVNGSSAHAFDGAAHGAFELPLEILGGEPGEWVTIRVETHGIFNETGYREVRYLLDDTAAEGMSISAVKAMY